MGDPRVVNEVIMRDFWDLRSEPTAVSERERPPM